MTTTKNKDLIICKSSSGTFKKCYRADDIYNYYYIEKGLKKGLVKASRGLIEKFNIPDDKVYFYTKNSNGETLESQKKVLKAKFIIENKWCQQNIIKVLEELLEKKNKQKHIECPPLIELEDKDMFQTENGEIIRIRTYGNRKNKDSVYFSVEDIEQEFGCDNLNEIILDCRNSYKYKEHYDFFHTTVPVKNRNSRTESIKPYQSKKSMLHFTFNGLMHWIQTTQSKSDSIHQYREWVNNTIFVHQMGTDEQREELINTLSNKITVKNGVDILSKTNKIAGIYLLSFGKLSNNKNSLPDQTYQSLIKDNKADTMLYKFGITNDLRERFGKYKSDHKKNNIENVLIEAFYPIDWSNKFTIEKEVREFSLLWNYKITTDKLQDWITMNDRINEKKRFKEFMNSASKNLSSTNESLQLSINEYIDNINNLTIAHKETINEFKMLLKDKDMLLKDKEIELLQEKHKNEIKDKDIEILQMKLKLAEAK